MPDAILRTKVSPPRTRLRLVPRLRLHDAFVWGEGRKLTLVSVPAGFVKTTLIGEWVERISPEDGAVAWVSLEESDNDPGRFLTFVMSALRTFEKGIGGEILASLSSPELPPIEAVMGTLVNELSGVERRVVIVLDDYHLVSSEPIHEAVTFLLKHLPENVHLIISSRTDPPLPLPKLRARDQITEIRAAELRFTTEEATSFLVEVMGLTLSEKYIKSLEEITEGWVAALQLVALSMRDRKDVSSFVESFSGSNRHILDFLAQEVLDRQPKDLAEFLLKTSMLERMSAPLCDALTDRSDGQDDGTLQFHVLPAQSQDLAAAKASSDGEDVERLEVIVSER